MQRLNIIGCADKLSDPQHGILVEQASTILTPLR